MFSRGVGLSSIVLSAEKPWIGERMPLGRMVTSEMVEDPYRPTPCPQRPFRPTVTFLLRSGPRKPPPIPPPISLSLNAPAVLPVQVVIAGVPLDEQARLG